jgi:hypothetical protein
VDSEGMLLNLAQILIKLTNFKPHIILASFKEQLHSHLVKLGNMNLSIQNILKYEEDEWLDEAKVCIKKALFI